jgi:hypothetical protein
MADAPWRCSQCGTINEPVANSCRTCGKWPSLFDIQDSVVEGVEREDAREPAPFAPTLGEPAPFEPDVVEPDVLEPAPFEPEPFEEAPVGRQPYELEGEVGDEPESSRRGRRWTTFIVPIAFAIYLVISFLFGERQ